MKVIRILALIFLCLSYLSLSLMFILENQLQETEFPYIFIVWGIGILNAVLNIYYGMELKVKNWVLVTLVICGLTWIFLPLLFTFFGIPFLVMYLIAAIYVHRGKMTESDTK